MANSIAFAALCLVVMTAAVIDVRTQKIPNWLTYPAVLAGFVFWAVAGGLGAIADTPAGWTGAGEGLIASLVSMSVVFVPFLFLYLLGGVNGGDLKLMGAVGAMVASWECALATAFYGFFFGGLIALIVMFARGLVAQTFRRIYYVLVLAAAKAKPEMPTDSPRIPLGVGLALGAVLAGLEYLLGVPMPWPGLGP